MDTDRNLLFAVLALQADLIDRERFVQACTLWANRKDIPIADLLIEQRWLTPDGKGVVDQLIVFKLRKHGGDLQASLAEAAGAEVRGALASVADADVGRSLAALSGVPASRNGLAPKAEDCSTVLPVENAGRNLVYEEIGRGGIGRVLRGRDPELRRDLAVKVLRDEHRDDDIVRRRFVEEAQVGGQLQHPGVVPVYELGRFADQRPYFTMKLVKGRTLADLLKERADPSHDLARFLTIFEQVCQTVAYAHSRGVIHRDLKPANVMVGAFGEVQVMDWGLAKVLGSQDGDPEATTSGTVIRTVRTDSTAEQDGRTGIVGTPAYMAPEQARGEVEAVDERADVFGLGAILCAILTGRPPHKGDGPDEAVRQAAAGNLIGAFRRLDDSGTDVELVALCMACLAPRREDRPREAGAVAARMAAYQAAVRQRLHQAELERAAAEARTIEERKRRRVSLALAAAVVALVALGAGGGLLVQHQAAERRADKARRHQTVEASLEKAAELRQQARWHEAAAVLDQIRSVLGDDGSEDLLRRLAVAQAELALVNRLDTIRQRRATIVNGEFDTATAARDYAAAFREAGLGEAGDDEEAVAARVRASGVAGPLVAALDDWAFLPKEPELRAWLLGVARRAAPDAWGDRFRDPAVWWDRRALRALADEALRDDGAMLSQLSPQMLVSMGLLLQRSGADPVPLLRVAQRRYPSDFWLNLTLGQMLRAVRSWGEATGYQRVGVALRPDAGAAHNNLGLTLADQKDLDGAIAEYQQAIAINPRDAYAHNNLGSALRDKKDLPGAIAEYRQALAINPNLGTLHVNLGLALEGTADLNGAIAAFRQAIAIDPNLADAHSALGNALRDQQDMDGAIAEYKQAIAVDPNLAVAHYNLGNALLAKKELEEAIAEFRRAIVLDPKLAQAHNNLGNSLLEKKEVEAAIAAFRKAIASDPDLAEAHNNLGLALAARNDFDGAIVAYRKAIELDPQFAHAHNNLGLALANRKDFEGAIAAYRKAIKLDPKYGPTHAVLGIALLQLGRFAEARTAIQLGMDRLPERHPLRQFVSQQIQQCEYWLALDHKLSAVLTGNAEPASAADRLALAQLCQRYKRQPATAARFYADAFAADPKLTADPRQPHRFNAACSAALAADGHGSSAKRLPDKVRLALRRQALAWLRDDLAACGELAEGGEPAAKQFVRQALAYWQQDADLASVRDLQALDQLPDDEYAPWRRLWRNVAALLKRVEEKQ